MKIGYIRITKVGPSPSDQRRSLQGAGIVDFSDEAPVYVDKLLKKCALVPADSLPERTLAIRSLREGDELVIADAGRLGVDRADMLRALGQIGAHGASVYVVSEDRHFQCAAEIEGAADFLDAAAKSALHERLKKARKARKPGSIGGRKSVSWPAGERLTRLQAMWKDYNFSAQQCADFAGVAKATLYRRLGNRTTPVFGRKS